MSNPVEEAGSAPQRLRSMVPFLVLFLVSVAFGVLFYQVVKSMLLPLFLAAVMALLTHPLFDRMVRWFRGRDWLAALAVHLLVLAVFIAPLSLALFLGLGELTRGIKYVEGMAGTNPMQSLLAEDSPWITAVVEWLNRWTPVEPQQVHDFAVKTVRDTGKLVYERSMQLLGDLPGLFLGAMMFLIAFYFLLVDGRRIVAAWEQLTPMDDEHDRVIRAEFSKVCRGVVWATVAAAIGQALLLGVGLLLIDLFFHTGVGKWTFLLALLTSAFAMLPFFGAAAIWVPTVLVMFAQGHHAAALVLTVYCMAVVSTVNNVLKVLVLKDSANLHPLLVFVCVFGGIDLVGVLGIFIGPIVGAVLFALMKILKQELLKLSKGA